MFFDFLKSDESRFFPSDDFCGIFFAAPVGFCVPIRLLDIASSLFSTSIAVHCSGTSYRSSGGLYRRDGRL